MSGSALTMSSAAKAAAGEAAYFKKLGHAALKAAQHLEKAAKYTSLHRAGLMAIVDGDVDQARRVDSMLSITSAGRVRLTDRRSFDSVRPEQLCDFLALQAAPAPKKRTGREIVDLSLEDDEDSAPAPRKRQQLALKQ